MISRRDLPSDWAWTAASGLGGSEYRDVSECERCEGGLVQGWDPDPNVWLKSRGPGTLGPRDCAALAAAAKKAGPQDRLPSNAPCGFTFGEEALRASVKKAAPQDRLPSKAPCVFVFGVEALAASAKKAGPQDLLRSEAPRGHASGALAGPKVAVTSAGGARLQDHLPSEFGSGEGRLRGAAVQGICGVPKVSVWSRPKDPTQLREVP
eukprot:CAMPEP_0175295990 /NCGR_PEP_ID=MMETSP0093-20121207/58797_1 /TAXON_ID=311494 /ORGANISM="Alexandrium monilatum, Strain CCMP3105" /LENGTH=207 /DNA_ID=CAMNT_0016591971 /DNA_START=123 /DNA_END=742 /DNA_ORIENTATION=-